MKALRLVFILIGTHCPEETRFRRGFSLSHGAGQSAALGLALKGFEKNTPCREGRPGSLHLKGAGKGGHPALIVRRLDLPIEQSQTAERDQEAA